MKNRIAFVFKSAPHGSTAGREGLDALLATSALTEDVGVFFINDGVFQILKGQRPEKILSRNYIATFKVLPVYNIKNILVCGVSLRERGLKKENIFMLNIVILTANEIHEEILQYHTILTF